MPFLAMEFLEGEPLDTFREKSPDLSVARLLRIARELAEGLAAAHHKGVIHRDIKPSNLWIEATTGHVKILDFGLARFSEDDMAQLTEHGLVLGTPAFMSPEQASGQAVDTRSDLFSLGCVLYWLCTNVSPFHERDLISTLTALAMKTPTPPHELNPTVPEQFSNLTMTLLAKDPAHRPETSRHVAEALAAI
jgi:serine/threonine protein kinase